MINFFLYLVSSVLVYLFVISISKYFRRGSIRSMLYIFVGSIHLNISENGIFAKYLHIVYSDSIAILSGIMILIYLVTGAFDDD